jgi:hypothetical protein
MNISPDSNLLGRSKELRARALELRSKAEELSLASLRARENAARARMAFLESMAVAPVAVEWEPSIRATCQPAHSIVAGAPASETALHARKSGHATALMSSRIFFRSTSPQLNGVSLQRTFAK